MAKGLPQTDLIDVPHGGAEIRLRRWRNERRKHTTQTLVVSWWVRQANAAVKNAQMDALANAYDDLQNALGDLPDDTTVGDAATSLQPQIAAVQSARQ
jgi:hypothetical protein